MSKPREPSLPPQEKKLEPHAVDSYFTKGADGMIEHVQVVHYAPISDSKYIPKLEFSEKWGAFHRWLQAQAHAEDVEYGLRDLYERGFVFTRRDVDERGNMIKVYEEM